MPVSIRGKNVTKGKPLSFGVPMRRIRVSSSAPPQRPRPPSFVVSGDYPHFYSPNLLSDPGFEFTLQNSYGKDPRWDEEDADIDRSTYPIPHYSATCTGIYPFHWPDPSSTCVDDRFWINWYQLPSTVHGSSDIGEDPSWRVSTINPFTGWYHLAWWRWSGYGSFPSSLGVQGIGLPYPMSARVTAGDAVTWRVYASVTRTSGDPQIEMHLVFYNQTGSPVKALNTTTALTTSYAAYQIQSNTPANSYYIRCYVSFGGTGTVTTRVDIDDGRVGVE